MAVAPWCTGSRGLMWHLGSKGPAPTGTNVHRLAPADVRPCPNTNGPVVCINCQQKFLHLPKSQSWGIRLIEKMTERRRWGQITRMFRAPLHLDLLQQRRVRLMNWVQQSPSNCFPEFCLDPSSADELCMNSNKPQPLTHPIYISVPPLLLHCFLALCSCPCLSFYPWFPFGLGMCCK